MRARTVTLPTLAMVASTRGMLGAGIGLLLASRLSDSRRRGVGRSLLAIGLLSTIPLVTYIFRRREPEPAPAPQPVLRSGGAVDAPGKHHKLPPPSRRGVKSSDQSIAKAIQADTQRHRPRA